jgi:serine/threonine protein kinase
MSKGKSTQFVESAFNGYQLLELLGEGGAGRVYKASDATGAQYAVKVMTPERATTDRRKRFQNEILFGLHSQHPNVVRILDHGLATTDKGSSPFYVMPLMQGSLRHLLQTNSENRRRLMYFDQVLSGVEAAHLKGVTHRDLKPENVLYNQANDSVVVADFGIARFTDEELYTAVETRPGDRLANFQYAAPEQRTRGRPTDARTDIYALGLMLNELFTGEVPFGSKFKTVGPGVPECAWVDEVVDEMTRSDPAERPASIDAVKQHLQRRQQDFVTRQRLSRIQNTVIPVGEEDDPLALEPPQIVDFTFENGQLTLILGRAVNSEWIQALLNMGSYGSLMGKGPDRFAISGNRASIPAGDYQVQQIIDFFKGWLPEVTRVYREGRQVRRQAVADAERGRLAQEREKLERQQRLRNTVRL